MAPLRFFLFPAAAADLFTVFLLKDGALGKCRDATFFGKQVNKHTVRVVLERNCPKPPP